MDTLNTGHVPDIDPKTATGRQAREYMAERQARAGHASGDGALTRARARGQSSSPSQ